MKKAALDFGTVWTGVALSDPLNFFAKPYKTTPTKDLDAFIKKLLEEESIDLIIVGLPITMRGTESAQTKLTIAAKEHLEKLFPQVEWRLLDERLSSKQADQLKRAKTKEEKIHSHSVAAAFILETYLQFLN
jgi:putative holliday junction resolvase